MNRIDYEIVATALAQAFVEANAGGEQRGVKACIEHVSHAFQIYNEKFSPANFMKYITDLVEMKF